MTQLFRCIYVSLLICLFTLAMFNCGGIEGEELELPLGEWVPVTSTKVPCHIKFGNVMKDSALIFYVATMSPQNVNHYDYQSRYGARVGGMLFFGKQLIHLQDPSKSKVTKYFDAKVIEFDSESNVATIVVLPENWRK